MSSRRHEAGVSTGQALLAVILISSALACSGGKGDVERRQASGVELAGEKQRTGVSRLWTRVDAQRTRYAKHLSELRRLDRCGRSICATLRSLASTLTVHRRAGTLHRACRALGEHRALYSGYALQPSKIDKGGSKETVQRRVLDCRVVLDGERILRIQLVSTATWLARLDADVITAAARYREQGRISAGLAERMLSLGRARARFRDKLAPIFASTGVRIPDDELFSTLATAQQDYEKAVEARADKFWSVPMVEDRAAEGLVRRLFPQQARLQAVDYEKIVAVGMHSKRWQLFYGRSGKAIKKTRLGEVVISSPGERLCAHREVVLYQHLRGPLRSKAVALHVGEDVWFTRCAPVSPPAQKLKPEPVTELSPAAGRS